MKSSDNRTKQDTPLDAPKPVATTVGAPTAAQQTSTSQPSTTTSTTKAPARPIIPADKAYSALASKIKVAKQPSSGSSFFGKLAQTPAIPKTPVVQKPIPLKKYIPYPRKADLDQRQQHLVNRWEWLRVEL